LADLRECKDSVSVDGFDDLFDEQISSGGFKTLAAIHNAFVRDYQAIPISLKFNQNVTNYDFHQEI
jgi:hypothetical protein